MTLPPAPQDSIPDDAELYGTAQHEDDVPTLAEFEERCYGSPQHERAEEIVRAESASDAAMLLSGGESGQPTVGA